jgi:hypothetical protein
MKEYPIAEVLELSQAIQSKANATPGLYSPDACLHVATLMILNGPGSVPDQMRDSIASALSGLSLPLESQEVIPLPTEPLPV